MATPSSFLVRSSHNADAFILLDMSEVKKIGMVAGLIKYIIDFAYNNPGAPSELTGLKTGQVKISTDKKPPFLDIELQLSDLKTNQLWYHVLKGHDDPMRKRKIDCIVIDPDPVIKTENPIHRHVDETIDEEYSSDSDRPKKKVKTINSINNTKVSPSTSNTTGNNHKVVEAAKHSVVNKSNNINNSNNNNTVRSQTVTSDSGNKLRVQGTEHTNSDRSNNGAKGELPSVPGNNNKVVEAAKHSVVKNNNSNKNGGSNNNNSANKNCSSNNNCSDKKTPKRNNNINNYSNMNKDGCNKSKNNNKHLVSLSSEDSKSDSSLDSSDESQSELESDSESSEYGCLDTFRSQRSRTHPLELRSKLYLTRKCKEEEHRRRKQALKYQFQTAEYNDSI